jgi:ABC-type multidrug transport system fused ATPase/permease subunit
MKRKQQYSYLSKTQRKIYGMQSARNDYYYKAEFKGNKQMTQHSKQHLIDEMSGKLPEDKNSLIILIANHVVKMNIMLIALSYMMITTNSWWIALILLYVLFTKPAYE